MRHDPILVGLDADQREAVTTDAAPLVIVAAAGSGKTTVLTRRIAHRLATGDADPQHVVAITFTRDAAGELRRRLRRFDIRTPIETGTFHAVALRFLRDRALATNTAPPAMATDRIRLVRETLAELGRRADPLAVAADLDWARARLIHPDDVVRASREARRRTALDGAAFASFVDRYTALKRRRRVLDFDDLLERFLAAMRHDPLVADAVRWRFRHLFVDEAQDLNPLQFALLQEMRGSSNDICLVGDPRQAIYGWNGADPTLLDRIEEHLPGVTIVRLRGNYRCTPSIVRTAGAALATTGHADDTESRRDDGRSVVLHTAADERAEADLVTSTVRGLVRRYGGTQVAVLARTNEQLPPLERALVSAGLPVARGEGRSALERCLAEVGTPDRDRLAAWVDQVWADDDASLVRRRVAEEVDRFLSSGQAGSFRAWVDQRSPFDDLTDDDSAVAVSLLTFHAAKGREWRAVVVTGVEQGLVPHASSNSEATTAEESRLLHVAITRGADEVVITAAETRSGRTTGPSPWWPSLSATVIADAVVGPSDELRASWRRDDRDDDPLAGLVAWRHDVARRAGVADSAVCSLATLRSLHADPPTDVGAIATRLGVSTAAAERLAAGLLAALSPASHE